MIDILNMTLYRIHRFSKLTGLSTHVIRAWERRYGLVTPIRGANRYRQYTDEDVALFRYLKGETDRGNSIGDLAEIGHEELLSRMNLAIAGSATPLPVSERLLSELITAIQLNERVEFERKLNGALGVVPFEEALQRFLLPLQERIGQLWHDEKINIAQEHYVTKQVQQKLFAAMNQLRVIDHGPKVIIACPSGEWHEIGAQTVAYLCAVRGCQIQYLGSDVPIEELAKLCEQLQPHLVLFSLCIPYHPLKAEELAQELTVKIRLHCPVGIGGSGVKSVKQIFERHHIQVFADLPSLEIYLAKIVRTSVPDFALTT